MTELVFVKFIAGLEYRDAEALDVGANYGNFTKDLAKKFSKVYAFEPNPNNYHNQLSLNLIDYTNVELLEKAIGWYDGKIKLFIAENPGEHTINPDVESRGGREKEKYVEIDCTTLDTFCSDKPNITFMKCDIESGENYIFRPECAGKTLSERNITLALETHVEVDLVRLYNDLFSYGYRKFLNEQGNNVSGLSPDQHYIITKT